MNGLLAIVSVFLTAAVGLTQGYANDSKNERPVSKEISSALSFGIKYLAPPPPPQPAEEADLRDSDKSHTDIILLPKYVVAEKRPPVFTERHLYSDEMLQRLAYQRYFGAFSRKVLNKYRLPINFGSDLTPETYALMCYEAEDRQRNLTDMANKVVLYQLSGDATSADELKDDTQRTFMRRSSTGRTSKSQ